MKLKITKAVIVIILIVIYSIAQNKWIDIEEFNVSIDRKITDFKGIRIAQISDIHLPSSEGFIDSIIENVQKAEPDLILMTGDLVDRTSDLDESGMGEMCRRLSEIAPCYAISGNHDLQFNYIKWSGILTENNVEVVDDKEVLFDKDGQKVIIMGLMLGSRYKNIKFDKYSEMKDVPRILLTHNPAGFESYFSRDNKIITDLLLCGHAHGGQVRIPFINQGLYAPGQGVLPKYTSGEYYSQTGGVMIVSRGLGNSTSPLRFNNRVHIPIINLKG